MGNHLRKINHDRRLQLFAKGFSQVRHVVVTGGSLFIDPLKKLLGPELFFALGAETILKLVQCQTIKINRVLCCVFQVTGSYHGVPKNSTLPFVTERIAMPPRSMNKLNKFSYL